MRKIIHEQIKVYKYNHWQLFFFNHNTLIMLKRLIFTTTYKRVAKSTKQLLRLALVRETNNTTRYDVWMCDRDIR